MSTSGQTTSDQKDTNGEKNKTQSLNDQIDEYLESNDMGHSQGSDKWKLARMSRIGGSEQATIEGVNRFSDIFKLILNKLGINKFDRSIKMQWGNLFEELIMVYVESDLNTTIKGADAFLRGKFDTQAYSPDGIAVVDMETHYTVNSETGEKVKHFSVIDKKPNNETNTDNDPTIVLLEFKCPYNRKLTGVIPEYYKPQIFAGMDTIKLTELAIFIEAMFRRCGLQDLNDTPVYDRQLTPRDLKRPISPIAYGFIGFTLSTKGIRGNGENVSRIIKELVALHKLFEINQYQITTYFDGVKSGKITDIGNSDERFMVAFMNSFGDKVLTPWYSPLVYLEDKNKKYNTTDIDESMNNFEKYAMETQSVVYGVLPFKLMKKDYMYEKKQDGYLDKWKPVIDEVINIVDQCKRHPEDKWRILSKYNSHVAPPVEVESTW